ncbi:hypothetical protein [Rubellimicrobium arenae]|uniref:hypothetical protein n=1 Tax=Rubellimicrobium arenae TaxID=2817372 RepID=UPI001B310006|nr:hypothetical protein [Rubellimicrobium arenae]
MPSRRSVLILVLATLVAISVIAPGGAFEPPPAVARLKDMGREITYAVLVGLFLTAALNLLFTLRGARPGVVVWAYSGFFIFTGAKFVYYDLVGPGLLYFGVFALYFVTFGLFLPKLSRSGLFDLDAAVTVIGLANLLAVAINLPTSFMAGTSSFYGRFSGLAFNANILAYALVLTSVCLQATVRNIPYRALRTPALMLGLGLNFYLIFLTQSRGGLILLVVSMLINFYFWNRTLFRVALVLSPCLMLLGWLFFLNSPLYGVIFADRGDTRGWVFERQWNSFMASPFFGDPWMDSRIVYGENLLLGAIAEMGLFGLLFVSLICLPRLVQFYRLGWRRRLPTLRLRQDHQLAAAFVAVTILSGGLESMLLGVVGPAIICFLVLDAASQSWKLPVRRMMQDLAAGAGGPALNGQPS